VPLRRHPVVARMLSPWTTAAVSSGLEHGIG
jgi:hypothetical protein